MRAVRKGFVVRVDRRPLWLAAHANGGWCWTGYYSRAHVFADQESAVEALRNFGGAFAIESAH